MRSLVAAVERLDTLTVSGRVAAVNGLLIEARGGLTQLAIGARAEIVRRNEEPLAAEVVGFRDARALLMPFGPVEGIAPGSEIRGFLAPEPASMSLMAAGFPIAFLFRSVRSRSLGLHPARISAGKLYMSIREDFA